MKIGIIVDGVSERYAIPKLYGQLIAATGNEFILPVYAPIQPMAPDGVIARACRDRIGLLKARGANLVIVLLDREARDDCCGALADGIKMAAKGMVSCNVSVVIKNRTFENWLIADLNALSIQRGRFSVTAGTRRAIVPDKADGVDGYQYVSRSVKGSYDKVADSRKICE